MRPNKNKRPRLLKNKDNNPNSNSDDAYKVVKWKRKKVVDQSTIKDLKPPTAPIPTVFDVLSENFGKRVAGVVKEDLDLAREVSSNNITLTYADRRQYHRDMTFVKAVLSDILDSNTPPTKETKRLSVKAITKLKYWLDII